MRNPVPKYTGLVILAIVSSMLAACTSAEELMEDGAKLEAEGRYVEAVRKYIAAYDKDPEIIGLEAKATDLGNQVIADLLAGAESLRTDNRPVESAETLMEVDDLVLRAFEAGLSFDRPADYADIRFETFREAVAELSRRARQIRDQGDLSAANRYYIDALERFDPTLDEALELNRGRFDVLVQWAIVLTDQGRYREATQRADEAVAISERARVSPEQALAVRARAIDLGTLYVAAAPVRARNRATEGMSPWFLGEINDQLELNRWSDPPEFIAIAHGALVRQRLRHMGLARRTLSRRDARRLAVELDADFVATSEIERFSWVETDVDERPKQTRTHEGAPATFYEIRGKLEYFALVRIMIVSHHGDVIYDDHFEERRHKDFRRAEYDGDWRDLDLSGGERRLFREQEYRDTQTELEEDVAERLTGRIAERVYDRLVREIR